MTGTRSHIDYEKIDFPSDHVTLKSLRSRRIKMDDDGENLEIMHMCERQFAALGYAKGLGDQQAIVRAALRVTGWDESVDGPYDEEKEVQKARESLAQAFTYFGVSDGIESGKLLISRLEEAAAAQARERLGGRSA